MPSTSYALGIVRANRSTRMLRFHVASDGAPLVLVPGASSTERPAAMREDGSMTDVRLSGQLVCRNTDEVAAVVQHLARHAALTRAEVGCVSFHVIPTDDPLVWQVDELFRDAAALRAHQDRVANSAWGRATAGIERRYTIDGL